MALLVQRFFPQLNSQLDILPDPRQPSHCTYRVRELIWLEVLMLLTGVPSRLQMVVASAAGAMHRNLLRLAGLRRGTLSRTAPHPDTAYAFLQNLPPAELEACLAGEVKKLLRQHIWDEHRFDGEWLVAVDATWVRSYPERHCPHCLTQRNGAGQVTYAHALLEAKLLLRNGMTAPMASVSIQNDDPDASKQDCELKALLRLAARLKARYPRLPICLTLDSLYAVAPVIALCEQYKWSYVAVMKEGRAPAFYPEVLAAAARGPLTTVLRPTDVRQQFTWACNQDYNGRKVHFVRCEETKPDLATPSVWGWITDRRPDPDMAPLIGNEAGRPRWGIEENFNLVKNGVPHQDHDFGSQGHAWYNTWLLAEFAVLLLQLVAVTDVLRVASAGLAQRLADAYQTLAAFAASLLAAAKLCLEPEAELPVGCRLHFFPAGP